MGLIPDASESDEQQDATAAASESVGGIDAQLATSPSSTAAVTAPRPARSTALRQSYGVPWFDGLVEGTRLGRMRRKRGVERSQDGQISMQWEVIEYTDGANGDDGDEDMGVDVTTPGKRKRGSSDLAAEAV